MGFTVNNKICARYTRQSLVPKDPASGIKQSMPLNERRCQYVAGPGRWSNVMNLNV